MSKAPRQRRFESSHSYGVVLGLVTASLFFALISPDKVWSRLVLTALFGVTLIVVVRTADARKITRRIVTGGVCLSLVAAIAAVIVGGDFSSAGINVIGALLVLLAPLTLARGIYLQIRQDGAITLRSVLGVVAVYLLIGMFFGAVIAAAQVIDEPYFNQGNDVPFEQILYFSFITLTTVGYGDFTPAQEFGRMVSVTEALLGQLYLVTVVGLIVGNMGRAPQRRRAPADQAASR